MKYQIIKYALYSIAFAFLHFVEWKMGVYGFSTALFFALVFSKQNVVVIAPLYAITGIAFNLSLWGALYLLSPILVTLLAMFVHYKCARPLTQPLMMLYAFISLLPRVGIGIGELIVSIKLVAGALLALPLTIVFISVLGALVRKKLKFPLSRLERASFCVVLGVFGLGLRFLNIDFFSFYWLIVPFALAFLPNIPLLSLWEIGLGLGIGALVDGAEPFVFCVSMAVLCGFLPSVHAWVGGIIFLIAECAHMLLNGANGLEYLSLIAPGVAVLITLVIPPKIKRRIALNYSFADVGLTRVMINRDRENMQDKLTNLSHSLFEVSEALASDDEILPPSQMELAVEVANMVCKRCANYQRCKKSLGGNGTEMILQELMGSALERGKVSILDASPFLSSRCTNLNTIIIKANALLMENEDKSRKERVASENKRLLKEQVEGLGDILEELGKEAGVPLRYDLECEKGLRDAFNDKGLGIKDVMVMENGELILSVKEQDINKTELRETISAVMGVPMWIFSKREGANGYYTTFWEREPKYRVAYGERVSPKDARGSGDKEAVIRLNSHKVMLCLADGMGHGKEAQENSNCAMSLIESLYKAGFNHETVLKSVGALLKVRNKEEFNAIDIAVIDTSSGEVDFIKQGAREGYVITPEGLKEISCGSLPLGIVDGAPPITESQKLTPYDFLVMFSDGIIDGLGKTRLEEILSSIKTRNPDEICEKVMENVDKLAPDERDDCSMICARLF